MTTNTLKIIADSIKTPFLGAIINTTQAFLKNIQTVAKHKDDCFQLLEKIHKLPNAIMILHIKSDAGGEMPLEVLDHVGKFTEILHKIYTFVEAQQKGNRVKSFFRQGEISTLLKDCQAGLQQSFDFFQIEETKALPDIAEMKKDAEKRHQEVLDIIEKLSEATASERASTMSGHHSWSSNSSNSISMLPSEPKIFHGRESELSDILHLFNTRIPRIAILGAAGMGKTSLARAVLHHPDILARYVQNRFFVACNSATTGIELANLIGSHLGLKPGKNLIQAVLQYFANNPPSLLILDELETLWEPASSRANIEELLSLLTGVEDLALMITMRGAEHPAKVQWTRPFLKLLQPLDQEVAQHTFVDIADNGHSLEEVDQILSLADNMPLAISLLAHLADTEGCSNVLSRWNKEKTSVISEGLDKRSNLDMSISLSLSSPRIQLIPDSQKLLSLLAMLPDGLTDVDLIQSKLPLENILKCKTALKSTALAYSDEHKRLKVLMPIREYLQQH
ncbi:P-loop containing nucleoside triphosphate hydrolase protein, partial [Mycena albidolilacea]